MAVILKLHLKDHCIETAAKKMLKSLTDSYFDSDNDNGAILSKIELIQEFIKTSDFPRLRAGNEKLSGTVESLVTISRDSGNRIKIETE